MNLESWLQLNVEHDEHLDNARMALSAKNNLPDGAGIIRHHLNAIAQREINLAWLAGVILDATNSPSKWKE